MAIGLFTARWALLALGQVDYGLMGVVGGLAGFISFVNNLLAVGVSRFYALSIGKASVEATRAEGLEDCHKWFSTAVVLHLLLATTLMCVGYPIGIWAVRNFLTIPVDRVADCVWVFRFVCISCYLGMISVPVNAMYGAKQYIAELTIYSFITTTLNACFLYYMITHPGVWLVRLSLWSLFLGVTPNIIILFRGLFIFKECRFLWRYAFSLNRLRQLSYYCGWTAIGVGAGMLRGNGVQILINKYFGPTVNASMAIANNVNGHTQSLSGSLMGAFQPAIMNAYGAGDLNRMRALAYRTGKFASLFILLFSIPLAIELDEVLILWLKNPPQFVYGLCLVMFVMTALDVMSYGHMMAVNAHGKIAMYQIVVGSLLMTSLPIAWLFCHLWGIVYLVPVALMISSICCIVGRVWFARFLAGMSAWYWLKRVALPIGILVVVTASVGCLPRLFFTPSFVRIVITTLVCESVFIPITWFVLLDAEEREYVRGRIPFLRKKEL